MNIKTLLACAAVLFQSDSPRSLLIQGPHGIGKSALAKKLARTHKAKSTGKPLKLIDKRLAQLTEGDIVGLPFKNETKRTTEWYAPDWIREACEIPCLLFLDEANRASGEVMQSSFQLVLDRCLGDNVLHPDTRIVVAVNNDSRLYQVNDMDPAYRDRFWQCELTPTAEEWIEWGEDTSPEGGNIHGTVLDFIRSNPSCLDPSDAVNPSEKQPSRRSWEGFNSAAVLSGFIDKDYKQLTPEEVNTFTFLAAGFLGSVGTQFMGHFKSVEKQVNAADIMNNYSAVAKRCEEMSQSDQNAVINRCVEWLRSNLLTEEQCINLGEFFKVLPGELAVAFWQEIAKHHGETTTNIKLVHKHIYQKIISAVNNGAGQPKASTT